LVQAAYRIFIQAKRLDQFDSEPLAVFVNENGITKCISEKKISDVLQSIVRTVHPDLSEDEIKYFSSHLGRVWELVLLDEAGTTQDFMNSCLRWMGESYILYLRDTSILQQEHVNILCKELDKVMRLLGTNQDILPNIVPLDDEMGEY
jgi:hypothetical protein